MRAFLGSAALSAVATLALAGCGSTVYRLPGEPVTPGGAARNACESEDWLVIAPTRAEVTNDKKTSHPETGLGIYEVGSDSPESIPSIEGLHSPSIEKKREVLGPYDRRQIIAGSLGAAGVIALTVGTILFVNAFESKSTVDPITGGRTEQNTINGTKAGLGGVFVGVGFGLGIAGLVVNPDNAERTQARATRKVFFDPPDDPKSVEKLIGDHNARIRSACAAH